MTVLKISKTMQRRDWMAKVVYQYKCFQLFKTTVAQKCHGNFNLLSNFNLLTANSQFYSRHFQFFHGNAHNIFRFGHHLSATAADSGLAPKVKTQNQKSIFQVDLQREK